MPPIAQTDLPLAYGARLKIVSSVACIFASIYCGTALLACSITGHLIEGLSSGTNARLSAAAIPLRGIRCRCYDTLVVRPVLVTRSVQIVPICDQNWSYDQCVVQRHRFLHSRKAAELSRALR